MSSIPLDYPSILKQRIAIGEINECQAVTWLVSHGIQFNKARKLLNVLPIHDS